MFSLAFAMVMERLEHDRRIRLGRWDTLPKWLREYLSSCGLDNDNDLIRNLLYMQMYNADRSRTLAYIRRYLELDTSAAGKQYDARRQETSPTPDDHDKTSQYAKKADAYFTEQCARLGRAG